MHLSRSMSAAAESQKMSRKGDTVIFVYAINKLFSMTCFSQKFFKVSKELSLPPGNADYGALSIRKRCKLLALMLTIMDDKSLVKGGEKDYLVVRRSCLNVLVNATADKDVCQILFGEEVEKAYSQVNKDRGFVNLPQYLFDLVLREVLVVSDYVSMALANATTHTETMEKIASHLEQREDVFQQLLQSFFSASTHPTGPNFDHLSSMFGNLCQNSFIRSYILVKNRYCFQEFLMELFCSRSVIRTKGVLRLVNNCCFEYDRHEWMLSADVDILSFILLPITGPETFSKEETEKLPLTVQNMLPDKKRESDASIRRCILETLQKFCATKKCREILREKNVYLILREYHLWEPDEEIKTVIEDVVNFLIRTEEEIGVDDLRTVAVPAEEEVAK